MCVCASVIPAIGFFCSGGRCVIVSVKPHVAKVVNPLGTVVTVQSDDESMSEITEDTVIHENCDEALFRPVVAPKTLVFDETREKQPRKNKSLVANEICAKNLKSMTELTYKITPKQKMSEKVKKPAQKLNNKSEVKIDVVLSKPVEEKHVEQTTRVTSSFISDFSDTFVDANDKFQPLRKLSDSKTIVTMPASDKLSSSPEDSVFQLDVFDFPKADLEPEPDDLNKLPRSLDTCIKIDDLEDIPPKNILNERQHVDNFSSSEENVIEEKVISKKPRKPKPKLGVRIPNVNKENGANPITTVTLPAKKSWSSIAATKTKEDDEADVTKNNLIEIDELESKDDLLKSDKNYDLELKVVCEDINVLKVYKSSDDEKVSSSQTETTESSDDSSKVPEIGMEIEYNTWPPIPENSNNSSSQTTKSSRRKSKKKKK